MYSIPLPYDDWTLLLVPRFAALGPAWQAAAIALLAAVPAGLLLWLYRYEMQLVRAPAAVALLGLRLAVVAALWFVALLQPTLTRTDPATVPGRLVVAADLSGSMGVTDPQRSPADKLRLARALGRLPGSEPDAAALVDRWVAEYATRGEGDGGGNGPQLAVAAEGRERQLHDGICDAVDGLTRAEIARLVLGDDGMGLVRRLSGRHETTLLGFDGAARDIDPDDLAGEPDPARPTDLSAPLGRSAELAGQAEEGPLLGVLLLSDGRHDQGPPPLGAAGRLAELGVPVYPVLVAGRGAPPDIAVTALDAPPQVFQGAEARVTVKLRVTGLPAQELRVELLKDGQPISAEHARTVKHVAGGRDYTVPFTVKLEEPGVHPLTARAAPAVAAVRERSRDNNERSAAVRVAEDRARVLLVDGAARWEYTYLANALARDKAVRAESVLFAQPRLGKIPAAELEKAGHPARKLPDWRPDAKTPDPLAGYEAIVLGDVDPKDLPPADRERLESFVSEQGGTLVIVAGKQSMPLAYGRDQKGDKKDPLMSLLPVEGCQTVAPKEGFAVALTEDGAAAPYLQLHPEPEASLARWKELPKHYWGVTGKAKPGATVLARAEVPGEKKARPGPADPAARDDALVVVQNYGFGKVLFVGLDSTWRWRYRAGDLYHHRFWGQVTRWAAADRLLPAGNEYARFGTKRAEYSTGDDVEVTVRMGREAPPLAPGAAPRAKLVRSDGEGAGEVAAVVELEGRPQSPWLRGTAGGLPPGGYRVELDIPGLGDKMPPPDRSAPGADRGTFRVLPAESREMLDVSGDEALLADLAARTGGRVVRVEDLPALAESLAGRVSVLDRREELRAWRDQPLSWYLLAAFLALLTLEWVARKAVGLP